MGRRRRRPLRCFPPGVFLNYYCNIMFSFCSSNIPQVGASRRRGQRGDVRGPSGATRGGGWWSPRPRGPQQGGWRGGAGERTWHWETGEPGLSEEGGVTEGRRDEAAPGRGASAGRGHLGKEWEVNINGGTQERGGAHTRFGRSKGCILHGLRFTVLPRKSGHVVSPNPVASLPWCPVIWGDYILRIQALISTISRVVD